MTPVEWRKAAIQESQRALVLPDITFMRGSLAETCSKPEFMGPLVEHVWSLHHPDIVLLKKLIFLFCEEFEVQMTHMTSPRISKTAKILKESRS
jgi:hypothetical protein